VLETEVRDGAQEFGLEEEVAEAGRVHAHVRALALLVVCARTRTSVVAVGTTSGGGGRGDRGLDDVLLVVCGCLPVSVRAQERRSAGVPMRSSVGRVEALYDDEDKRGQRGACLRVLCGAYMAAGCLEAGGEGVKVSEGREERG
jgi:hypothetical protein